MSMSVGKLAYGDRGAQLVSGRFAGMFATLADLKALGSKATVDGMLARVKGGRAWRFYLGCALTGDDLLVAEADSGDGCWLLEPGRALLSIPFTFAKADAAVLVTTPAGCIWRPREFFWGVDADFTGGAASAIGVSSSKAAFNTKGDLLGGATGDVAATLVAANSPVMGTIGAGFDSLAKRRALFVENDTLRFDRITSAFTAGSGSVNVIADIYQNAGA